MSNLFDDCSDYEKPMYESAYHVISTMEMWDFLKNYSPPPSSGYMFDSNSTITNIQSEIQKAYNYNHSGCSMAMTIRKMEQIAKISR